MNAFRAKPLKFPWPPLLYGAAVLIALALGHLFPIPVAHEHSWILSLVGYGFVVLAITIDIWAVKTLLDRHTAVLPNRCATCLVTCGPFRFTRNPIYFSYTLAMTGLGLATINPWFFITANCRGRIDHPFRDPQGGAAPAVALRFRVRAILPAH
ncbi:protein-S-isoprenylcysteine O-methyltransferase Ste14 [Sinorhizobium meliloti]